jgi:hypothetical protein
VLAGERLEVDEVAHRAVATRGRPRARIQQTEQIAREEDQPLRRRRRRRRHRRPGPGRQVEQGDRVSFAPESIYERGVALVDAVV